ncbi:MAG: ribosomal RNA small subunit methyltransferase A [Candidatus Cloacimonetes bacterium]|nr:ribosomal RNA small subunit methyltransferase A [Candidatus Cloacimonadota bacterium]
MAHPKAIKSLGQNFLHDPSTIGKIEAALRGVGSADWLEIGCGPGVITKELAKLDVSLLGVEIDTSMQEFLNPLINQKTKFLWKDVLFLNEGEILQHLSSPYSIVGNVPYYITTAILEHVLEKFSNCQDIFLMVQKEFAERMIENGSSKTRSRLTIFCNYYADCRRLFVVKRGCFQPAPEVDSAFVHLRRRVLSLGEADTKLMFRLIKAGYASRRKILSTQLAQNLGTEKIKVEECLKSLGMNPTIRAEELNNQHWILLTNEVKQRGLV